METIVKTKRIGGSLMVTIPKTIVEEESLLENQIIAIEIKRIKKSGFGMFKGLGPFAEKDKFRGQLES